MRLAVALCLAVLAGCDTPTVTQSVDFKDLAVPTPSQAQLDGWQREFEGGTRWRSDARRLAHEEILARLDVPWKGEPFDAARYQFVTENPEHLDWGSYVTRGWTDRSGRRFRYRVKVARYRDIWYAREVSHYVSVTLEDPFFDDNLPPHVK